MLTGWAQRLESRVPPGRLPELPGEDSVQLDQRQHLITLAVPAVRTVLGILALLPVIGGGFVTLLFAASVAVWARVRLNAGLRTTAIAVVIPVVLIALSDSLAGGTLIALGLLLWNVEDAAAWYTDRLVVTNKRVYRLYGVFTTHSPSIALTAVSFIDPEEPLIGRLLGYGTLLLDTSAQRDEPLARFDYLPHIDVLHKRILELRSSALPKWPPGQ